jgi:hypothetical protein
MDPRDRRMPNMPRTPRVETPTHESRSLYATPTRYPTTPGQGGAQNDEPVAIMNRARTGDLYARGASPVPVAAPGHALPR